MTKRREIGNKPAGKNDKINLTYTEFAADREKSEIRIGEGNGFENDILLKSFGFEVDNSGTLTMKAIDNDKIHIEEKENKIERIVGGKAISSAIASKAKIDRMIAREKENVVIDTESIEKAVHNVRRRARASKGSDIERGE